MIQERETLQALPSEMKAVGIEFEQFECPDFRAEFTLKGDDLVFHFFFKSSTMNWWKYEFPKFMEAIAKQHFNADYPQLVAAYSEELESWWLRAANQNVRFDPMGFARRYCQVLQHAIESTPV